MKRRSLLKALPAALAVGAAPAIAAVAEETPVQRAYKAWEAARIDWEQTANADLLSDDEETAWCHRVYKLADDVLDQPSTGPLDFVYKLMAHTFYGDHEVGNCPRGEELWAEARALVA